MLGKGCGPKSVEHCVPWTLIFLVSEFVYDKLEKRDSPDTDRSASRARVGSSNTQF